jgi:hypothetical protein
VQLEQTGSTIFQTFAGLSLDIQGDDEGDPTAHNAAQIQYLLNTFVVLNFFQVVAILAMTKLDKRRQGTEIHNSIKQNSLTGTVDTTSSIMKRRSSIFPEEQTILLANEHQHYHSMAGRSSGGENKSFDSGEVFMYICGGLIAFSWVLFFGTAWMRLRSKGERGH